MERPGSDATPAGGGGEAAAAAAALAPTPVNLRQLLVTFNDLCILMEVEKCLKGEAGGPGLVGCTQLTCVVLRRRLVTIAPRSAPPTPTHTQSSSGSAPTTRGAR